MCYRIFILFTILFVVNGAMGEYFTALADMEGLLTTESELITNLEAYIAAQEGKLSFLKKKVQEYKREHDEASDNVTTYLANPINAYLLTKRLTLDWRQIENSIAQDAGQVFFQNISQYRDMLKFPTEEDLEGAAIGLVRLQETYNLNAASVSRGILNNAQYSVEMSMHDCFELGRQSYLHGDYHHTVQWMNEALLRQNYDQNTTIFPKRSDILEYLAYSTYKEGNIEEALRMTKELVELVPDNEVAQTNLYHYEQELTSRPNLKGDDDSNDIQTDVLKMGTPKKLTDRYMSKLLCRGVDMRPASETRHLRCKYLKNNHPFLMLAPFKMEEANLHPYILLFYDVMSDKEIELIKKKAQPKFKRATAHNAATGNFQPVSYRISKSAWLGDEVHKYIADITQRTADMTGLNMKTVEDLQVVNYGIGGHYETHFDFARRELNYMDSQKYGNRIATILYYMTDVEQGGATVFPRINLAVRPKKGSAVFWYNLFASGEGDTRTRHAACPVLTGTKWVANKWVHEREQEFKRPCHLAPDHPEILDSDEYYD